ncbi:MAG: ABC transporter permease [Bacteroidales bacterium]|nr:ABC transporter permease [Candidatus Latescibacterota bacterium]
MLKNFVVTVLRNMRKHKIYSSINVLGLAVGMACVILISLYIKMELSFDRFHEKVDRICRLEAILTLGEKPNPIASTNFPPTLAMRDDYPEVVNSVRFVPRRKVLVGYGHAEFYEENIFYAEESVFDIFTFPMIKGDPATALAAANTVVITEEMAGKYFGTENPVGKSLKLNNQTEFEVTGVIENIPGNSHLTFDMLLSFQTFLEQRRQVVESWSSYFGCYGFVLLAEGTDYRDLEAKLPGMKEKYLGDSMKGSGVDVEYFLNPITNIHLHSHKRHEMSSNSDIMYIYIFGVVALFILLMACINFMNLATARSAARAGEIGMRKVLGASRRQIIFQFFGESVFYSLVSLVIAIILAKVSMPLFNSLASRELEISFSRMPWLIPALAGLAIFVGLVAGSYPAILLSRFNPVKVLKSKVNAHASNPGFRKVLVVAQFTISIALIIATLIVIDQLDYMKNRHLGFDKEQVVVIPIKEQSMTRRTEEVKSEMLRLRGVSGATASSHVPGGNSSGGSFVPEGMPDGASIMMNVQNIDEDYVEVMGMELVMGRSFSKDMPADSAQSIMVNEAALRLAGWDDAIGKSIYNAGDPDRVKRDVVGVIRDFHYKSLHMVIEPLFITISRGFYRNVFVRIEPGNVGETLASLEKVWKQFDPDRPFEYYFLDESFDGLYRVEEKLQKIFFNFTLLAIFIACLGLFGLASFAAEQRTREIGIRKVLGASVSGIVMLLTKEFTKWVLISNLIAWPVAWYAMKKYLDNFAYHTEIRWGFFLFSGAAALVIALATVSFQTAKAAATNPVEAIKYE